MTAYLVLILIAVVAVAAAAFFASLALKRRRVVDDLERVCNSALAERNVAQANLEAALRKSAELTDRIKTLEEKRHEALARPATDNADDAAARFSGL